MRQYIWSWIALVCLGWIAAPDANVTPTGTLLSHTNLVYQGAFRLPEGTLGNSSFAYGGTALAFNPARGSLFIVGHDWHQNVAEIGVPAIRSAATVDGLAVAPVLQPFTDVTEGTLGLVGPNNVKVGGLLPYQGKLYVTAYIYYDANGEQVLSHYVSDLDLSIKGDVKGPYRVGSLKAGYISGYFGLTASAWREALGGPVLNGNCCLGIISRTSYGPAVFAIDPTAIGRINVPPALPLVYYPASNPLLAPGTSGDGWGNTSELFNGTTEIRGVVMPEGSRSVLFFGRQGTGKFCYGTGEECSDPTQSAKGVHAYPYRYQVWAYDAMDLVAVKSGRRQPWSVKPYAVWPLQLPFASPMLQGATYDAASGRVFISTAFGDGERPIIHVLGVKPSMMR